MFLGIIRVLCMHPQRWKIPKTQGFLEGNLKHEQKGIGKEEQIKPDSKW